MKIAIGKIGKSIAFNSNNWGATGGDNEAPVFYENLFHKNPEHTFYLIGISDYSRLPESDRKRINKNNNVIDPWADWTAHKESYTGDDKGITIAYMEKWRTKPDTPRLDCGVFFMGPTATTNVFGKAKKMTAPNDFASPLFMQCKYAAPIVDYINEEKLKYILILNDPRYYPANIKDLFVAPSKILSQYTESYNHRALTSYENHNLKYTPVEGYYSAMETIFLIGKKKGEAIVDTPASLEDFFDNTPVQEGKHIEFMIVCNEGRPSRYPDLKKYILDHIENIDIYGKWEESTIGNDPRFKGPRKFNDLQKLLPSVKYTFCIPIKKGWCTAKFWEMAHYGIIPFLHPTYDSQHHIKCPDILRVTDSKDLFNKIKFLNENPEAYEILRTNIDAMLNDAYYDGSYLNYVTMQTLKDL